MKPCKICGQFRTSDIGGICYRCQAESDRQRASRSPADKAVWGGHSSSIQDLITNQSPWNLESLQTFLEDIRGQDFSLRAIAKALGNGITHVDLSRILNGIEPKSTHKRKVLGLPILIPAPACPDCGIVHMKGCPQKNKRTDVRLTFRLSRKEKERARFLAEQLGWTQSELGRKALKAYLDSFILEDQDV